MKNKRALTVLALLLFVFFSLGRVVDKLFNVALNYAGAPVAPLDIIFAVLNALLTAAVDVLPYAALAPLAMQCVKQWDEPLPLSRTQRVGFRVFTGLSLLACLGCLVGYGITLPYVFGYLENRPMPYTAFGYFGWGAVFFLALALALFLLARQKKVGFLVLPALSAFLAAVPLNWLSGLPGRWANDYMTLGMAMEDGLTQGMILLVVCLPTALAWLVIRKRWKAPETPAEIEGCG